MKSFFLPNLAGFIDENGIHVALLEDLGIEKTPGIVPSTLYLASFPEAWVSLWSITFTLKHSLKSSLVSWKTTTFDDNLSS